MKRRTQIRYSKRAGYGQMIGWGVMLLIGLIFIIPNAPAPLGVFWAGLALVGVIIGAVNAFSDKGIPTGEIITDEPEEHELRSTEERLLELDDLLHKELISDAEYADMRRRILSSH